MAHVTIDEKELAASKQARKYVRSDITRSYNKILADIDSLSINEVETYISRLTKLQNTVEDADGRILNASVSCGIDDASMQAEYDESVNYTNKLLSSLNTLKARLKILNSPSLGSIGNNEAPPANGRNPPVNRKLKLPQIPLPVYAHKEGENLHKFFSNFENILGKDGLSDYEMFIYLQGQLSGEPLMLIQSLDIGSQSYNAAKDLLTKAFASVVTQQFETIKRLSDLKFSLKSPYEYIGKLRQIQESFKSLKITSDIVLQYFFWQSLPESLQNQLVNISNSNKPNLNDIVENIFDAMERYLDKNRRLQTKKSESSPEVSNYAVSMNPYIADKSKPTFCSLCSSKDKKCTTHSTYNCHVYPSTKDKIGKLNATNGCVKCGNTSHETKSCQFRFRKTCMNCGKYHFTYLCTRNENPIGTNRDVNAGKSYSKNSNKQVNSGCIWVAESTLNNAGCDTIMPTFSCVIDGTHVRVLRDSGCQASFITDKMAKKLKLNVVKENYSLSINGFNSTNKINTKIVECKINKNESPISLICVPEIRTKLSLPGLSGIVKEFDNRGYKLADKFLLYGGDTIENISLILGDNEAQIVPQTDVKFGNSPSSLYSETPYGIMLMGGIERMGANVQSLSNLLAEHSENKVSAFPANLKIPSDSHVDSGTIHIESSFNVLDVDGKVNLKALDQALDLAMKSQCDDVMSYDSAEFDDNVVELDRKVVNHVVDNTTRDDIGRLRMPLIWKDGASDQLADNFQLSKAILKSNLNKLQKSSEKLLMYDQVIKDQEKGGVIEQVGDIHSFIKEHPTCSFLAHMGVFRMSNESTKCRVVYLSNLADKRMNKAALSHNQALLSGPCCNKKLATAICDLRFDKYLLCFDVIKAFLNIELYPSDQEKLLFLWFRNVSKGDYTVVAYKCVRLAFGLPSSPFILSMALYIILMTNVDGDEEELRKLKTLVYSLTYVDNAAVTANDKETIVWMHGRLKSLFEPYQFYLQQYNTNCLSLQDTIDNGQEETPQVVKLMGLMWDRSADTLTTRPLHLDPEASTKRTILSSIASNYDLFQYNGPLLNRARIYMHELQCSNSIGWDDKLNESQLSNWKNISRQVNSSPSIQVPRFVGKRDESYNLIVCTDASRDMYGAVVYLERCSDGSISFLSAKNRIVGKQLEGKTIPSLEFHALTLGVDLLMEFYKELASAQNVTAINIENLRLCSDSMVSLNWLQAACYKLQKLQKLTPFVRNRLEKICKLCDIKPVEFCHIPGKSNPADCISRCLSYNQLVKSNYISGPNMADILDPLTCTRFMVPAAESAVEIATNVSVISTDMKFDIPLAKYSSFSKLYGVYFRVLQFVNKLKAKVNASLNRNIRTCNENALPKKTWDLLILAEQAVCYEDVVKYLKHDKSLPNKDIPPIVTQLNIFMDSDGILRVQSKFDRWAEHVKYKHPVLLSKNSPLTSLIIRDLHCRKGHAGCYATLNELRRDFYVPNHFSVVKKALKECIICRRVNGRTIKTTQNSYKSWRVSPPNVPFRYIFLDHFGPFYVKIKGMKVKVWVLCITCLWSRSIALKLCLDLTTTEFLKAFQIHIFEFGSPELVLSDLGSQIVAGGNVISGILNDSQVSSFLKENGMQTMTFEQYPKGNHDLGGLVESCVKISKRMIYGCIGKQVLDIFDFSFTLAQATCLVNKRPIAFKESLRDSGTSGVLPAPITPECLLRGHDLVTLNILPCQNIEVDPDWTPDSNSGMHIQSSFNILHKNRNKLNEIYNEEFIADLSRQATNTPDKYRPVKHDRLEPGDVVLLKEPNTKCLNFPMGIVTDVTINSIGEVTKVDIRKGNREKVQRHVNSLILLLKNYDSESGDLELKADNDLAKSLEKSRPKRQAAIASKTRTAGLISENLV